MLNDRQAHQIANNLLHSAERLDMVKVGWLGRKAEVIATDEERSLAELLLWVKKQIKLEWDDLWEEMVEQWKSDNNDWTPTTEHMFHEMLGAVPPTMQRSASFLVGEPWNHYNGEAVYAAFKARDGKYFAKYMTVKQYSDEM